MLKPLNFSHQVSESDKSARGGAGPSEPRDTGKQAEIAFRLYDKDRDGFITKSEMEKLSKTLTKEQIDKVLSQILKAGFEASEGTTKDSTVGGNFPTSNISIWPTLVYSMGNFMKENVENGSNIAIGT